LIRAGIVTGMISEAGCLDQLPATDAQYCDLRFCAGGSPGRAESGAENLLADGAGALISFGVAGALDPQLRPGDLLVADTIVSGDGNRYDTTPAWSDGVARTFEAATTVRRGVIATTETPIITAEAKRSTGRALGAIAVDMESARVAAAAARGGIPFIAIRAIGDPASRDLPKAALAGLAPDGATRPAAVIAQLALRPWDLLSLIQLGKETARALKTLRRIAALGLRSGL